MCPPKKASLFKHSVSFGSAEVALFIPESTLSCDIDLNTQTKKSSKPPMSILKGHNNSASTTTNAINNKNNNFIDEFQYQNDSVNKQIPFKIDNNKDHKLQNNSSNQIFINDNAKHKHKEFYNSIYNNDKLNYNINYNQNDNSNSSRNSNSNRSSDYTNDYKCDFNFDEQNNNNIELQNYEKTHYYNQINDYTYPTERINDREYEAEINLDLSLSESNSSDYANISTNIIDKSDGENNCFFDEQQNSSAKQSDSNNTSDLTSNSSMKYQCDNDIEKNFSSIFKTIEYNNIVDLELQTIVEELLNSNANCLLLNRTDKKIQLKLGLFNVSLKELAVHIGNNSIIGSRLYANNLLNNANADNVKQCSYMCELTVKADVYIKNLFLYAIKQLYEQYVIIDQDILKCISNYFSNMHKIDNYIKTKINEQSKYIAQLKKFSDDIINQFNNIKKVCYYFNYVHEMNNFEEMIQQNTTFSKILANLTIFNNIFIKCNNIELIYKKYQNYDADVMKKQIEACSLNTTLELNKLTNSTTNHNNSNVFLDVKNKNYKINTNKIIIPQLNTSNNNPSYDIYINLITNEDKLDEIINILKHINGFDL